MDCTNARSACTQKTKGAMETHMYDTHGIGGISCMFCPFITPNYQSLYIHCNKHHDINITGIKFEL